MSAAVSFLPIYHSASYPDAHPSAVIAERPHRSCCQLGSAPQSCRLPSNAQTILPSHLTGASCQCSLAGWVRVNIERGNVLQKPPAEEATGEVSKDYTFRHAHSRQVCCETCDLSALPRFHSACGKRLEHDCTSCARHCVQVVRRPTLQRRLDSDRPSNWRDRILSSLLSSQQNVADRSDLGRPISHA